MSDLHVPARHSPLTRNIPFPPPLHPNAPEPESEYPGVWDWTIPFQAKRPSGGPEGVPETQPDTNDLLNVALTVIAGLSIGVVVTTVLRLILPHD